MNNNITWLHLSDLHFRASDIPDAYNMNIVLEAFLRDVPDLLDEDELRPDFLAITGDIAFSGQTKEYELAWNFLDKLVAELNGMPKERIFIVPGNHDVNRDSIIPMASTAIDGLSDRDKVNSILGDKESLSTLLKKFDNYAIFLQSHLKKHPKFNEEKYFFVKTFDLADKEIAIMGLNSAWASKSDEDEKVKLLLGEHQVRDAVKKAEKSDIRLALMHHPFDLFKDFDREDSEALLTQRSNFILKGHRHDTKLVQKAEPDSNVMILSAGACYQKRTEFNSCNHSPCFFS